MKRSNSKLKCLYERMYGSDVIVITEGVAVVMGEIQHHKRETMLHNACSAALLLLLLKPKNEMSFCSTEAN